MPRRVRNSTLRAPFLAATLLMAAPAAAQDAATLDLGEQIFTTDAMPPCALCHTLADAEAAGALGPNLDDLQPTEDRVHAAVADGVGVMPAYEDTLSEEEIAAVAAYVANAVGQGE